MSFSPELTAAAVVGIGALAVLGVKLQPFISAMRADVATDESRRKHLDGMLQRETELQLTVQRLNEQAARDARQIGELTARVEAMTRQLDHSEQMIGALQQQVERLISMGADRRT